MVTGWEIVLRSRRIPDDRPSVWRCVLPSLFKFCCPQIKTAEDNAKDFSADAINTDGTFIALFYCLLNFYPYCSHYGGVWERCIRTTRKILQALLREETTDDEGLVTLLCEMESIMNGRPFTTVSSDPQDQEPLTPNHLLLLRSESPMPPGLFRREDQLLEERISC